MEVKATLRHNMPAISVHILLTHCVYDSDMDTTNADRYLDSDNGQVHFAKFVHKRTIHIHILNTLMYIFKACRMDTIIALF